jgi:C1A family cysteine protease
MNKAVVFLFLFAATAFAVASTSPIRAEFERYIEEWGKQYKDSEEKEIRYSNFVNNRLRIMQWNSRLVQEGKEPIYGINGFSDQSDEEFRSTHTCRKEISFKGAKIGAPAANLPQAAPAKYDWRDHGAVTAVKNQGQCGSCWAFSATEGVESANFMAGRPLDVLSPQQITSCDKTCAGCNGGDLPEAFTYVIQNGLELDSSYPYTSGSNGQTGQCKYSSAAVVQTIKSYEYATKSNNETQMYVASSTYGPLSVCVDASTWSSYRSGIMTSNCPTLLDHCVQIVGWDTTYSTPYWIVKNSWGTTWGENGYLRIEMFKDLCGIAKEATYALA